MEIYIFASTSITQKIKLRKCHSSQSYELRVYMLLSECMFFRLTYFECLFWIHCHAKDVLFAKFQVKTLPVISGNRQVKITEQCAYKRVERSLYRED